MSRHYARPLVQLALVLTLATGATACSTMADLDPTGLLSEDEAPTDGFSTDSAEQANADANTTTPDLAAIPARPAATDTAAQADATQSVAAAGAQAQYSADALRAGTEAAAPAPVASDSAAQRQALALASAAAPSADAPPSAGSALAGGEPPSAAAAPAAAPAPVAAASAPTSSAPAPSPSPAIQSAALPPAAPPGAEPAVPAVPMTARGRTAMMNPSDAQLGFKPSTAPALNPSINQWVSPPILAHYRQTAALAGTPGTAAPAVGAVPAKGRGGQAMSGSVIANLDAVPGTPSGMAASMNGGVPPTAIVYFTGDGTALSVAARNQVRDAVAAFRANGAGSIKVVGHASSRTANMTVERHLEAIFAKSQARANVVAQALIRAGVPADKVIVEAVGDSQPIYYESMPKGEDGNRRTEIFLQS